ncbi:MAG: protein kinase, partial [Actinomycetota bacterium]|nr:protein kinase [Actinomycetota bacterium]
MKAGERVQDRYELIEPLGRGGMAEVWLARDARLERDVAIKFMAANLCHDPEFLVRFFSEAQAVARISHPNVVSVLDFGDFEDRPYLVMECVPGGALSDLTGEPMLPERAVEIVAAAARGAGAAHLAGLVHRDVKPGNILLDETGEPKLADFGIASSAPSEKLTAT